MSNRDAAPAWRLGLLIAKARLNALDAKECCILVQIHEDAKAVTEI